MQISTNYETEFTTAEIDNYLTKKLKRRELVKRKFNHLKHALKLKKKRIKLQLDGEI